MKATTINSPSFCANVKYYNNHLQFKNKPKLVQYIEKVLQQQKELPEGYHYGIIRKGSRYVDSDNGYIPEISDEISLTICRKDGESVTEPRIISCREDKKTTYKGLSILKIKESLERISRNLSLELNKKIEASIVSLMERANSLGCEIVKK